MFSYILEIVEKPDLLSARHFTGINNTITIGVSPSGGLAGPILDSGFEFNTVQTKDHKDIVLLILLDFREFKASEYFLGNLAESLGELLVVCTNNIGYSDVNNGLGARDEDDRIALVLVNVNSLLGDTFFDSVEIGNSGNFLEEVCDLAEVLVSSNCSSVCGTFWFFGTSKVCMPSG